MIQQVEFLQTGTPCVSRAARDLSVSRRDLPRSASFNELAPTDRPSHDSPATAAAEAARNPRSALGWDPTAFACKDDLIRYYEMYVAPSLEPCRRPDQGPAHSPGRVERVLQALRFAWSAIPTWKGCARRTGRVTALRSAQEPTPVPFAVDGGWS